MSDLLVISGLFLIGVGVLVLLYLVVRPTPQPEAVAQDIDLGKALEEIRKILESVERRFRVPLIIVFTGLTLAILGVYLEAKEAADQAAALIGRW